MGLIMQLFAATKHKKNLVYRVNAVLSLCLALVWFHALPVHLHGQTSGESTRTAASVIIGSEGSKQGLKVTKQVVFEDLNQRLGDAEKSIVDFRIEVSVRQNKGTLLLHSQGMDEYLFLNPLQQSIETIPIDFNSESFRHIITRQNPDEVLIYNGSGGEIGSYSLQTFDTHFYTEEPSRKNIIGSSMIPMDTELYFFSGYGFWENHNIISTFSINNAQWSSIQQVEPIPRTMSSMYLRGANDHFYNILPNSNANSQGPFEEGFTIVTSRYPYAEWTKTHSFSVPPMQIRHRTVKPTVEHHSSTDYSRHGLVVSAEFTREGHFENGVLMYDSQNNQVRTYYNPDLGAKQRLLSILYLDKADSWIILSVPHNNDTDLYVNFVEFDDEGINVKTFENELEREKRARTFQVTAAGLGSTALIGFLVFFQRQRSRSWAISKLNDLEDQEDLVAKVRLQPIQTDDVFSSINVNGQDEDLSRDWQYQKFWSFVLDAIRRGQDSIPLQELDDHVFHSGVKQPQRTRTRKRFVDRVNELAGDEIVRIERSSVDRRFRVLRVKYEAIDLTSDSST